MNIDDLLIRVTYRCNQNCSFCFNKVFSDKVDYKTFECLDIEKIKEFINENNVKNIYISGGEPTVYEDIKHFTKEMSKLGKVFYFTNGYLLEKFTDEDINDMSISNINMSIYTNEIIDGPESFLKKCERLQNLKNKYPNINLNAQVMIDIDFFKVVNSKYYKLLNETFDRVNFQVLALPKESKDYKNTLEGMPKKDAYKILDYLDETSFSKKSSDIRKMLDGDNSAPCLMGRKYITINPNMTINLCPHRNNEFISLEEFNKIKYDLGNMNNGCLSMRCVSLQSFLNKKHSR